MAANVKVIHARDFIRATPEGVVDMEAAERLLAEIAEATESLEDYEILIDTRQARGALSASQLWYLAKKLGTYRGTFLRRTAVLCPFERFDHAEFFALCASHRGHNVIAFRSYEDAMEWLLGGAASDRSA
jgi:hypothetical protein